MVSELTFPKNTSSTLFFMNEISVYYITEDSQTVTESTCVKLHLNITSFLGGRGRGNHRTQVNQVIDKQSYLFFFLQAILSTLTISYSTKRDSQAVWLLLPHRQRVRAKLPFWSLLIHIWSLLVKVFHKNPETTGPNGGGGGGVF